MEYRVLLRKKVQVHGDRFHVELRKYRLDYFLLVNVYDRCEHDRGIPYTTLTAALRSFEDACGVKLTKEMKVYLGGREDNSL